MNHASYRMGKEAALEVRERAGIMSPAELADAEYCATEWTPRDFTNVPRNSPFVVNDRVYRLLQPYDGTVFTDPPDNPSMAAMWGICHTSNPANAKPFCKQDGVRNVYNTGNVYIDDDGNIQQAQHDGISYNAKDYPAGWKIIPKEN